MSPMTPKVKAWLPLSLLLGAAAAGWDARRPSARTAAAVVVVMVFEGMGSVLSGSGGAGGEELLQAGEVVGVDVVHAGVGEFGPEGVTGGAGLVRGGPEADAVAVGVCLGDVGVQPHALGFGHGTHALPGEELCPVVADQRHEPGGHCGGEVGGAAV